MMMIASFSLGVLSGHWYAGVFIMMKKAKAGETVEFGDVFKGFDNFGPTCIAGIIYVVLLNVGMALYFIPGLIVGGFLLWFIPLVVFQNMPIGDAINKTKDIALTSLVNHILFFTVIYFVILAGCIFCGVGVFLTAPIGVGAMYLAYEDIVEGKS